MSFQPRPCSRPSLINPAILLSILTLLSAIAAPAAADSLSIASTSQLSLLGAEPNLASQQVDIGPAAPPNDWSTLEPVVFPTLNLAFGEYVNVLQTGTAFGLFSQTTGQMSLAMPIRIVDSDGDSFVGVAQFTTERTSGEDSSGDPMCDGVGFIPEFGAVDLRHLDPFVTRTSSYFGWPVSDPDRLREIVGRFRAR